MSNLDINFARNLEKKLTPSHTIPQIKPKSASPQHPLFSANSGSASNISRISTAPAGDFSRSRQRNGLQLNFQPSPQRRGVIGSESSNRPSNFFNREWERQQRQVKQRAKSVESSRLLRADSGGDGSKMTVAGKGPGGHGLSQYQPGSGTPDQGYSDNIRINGTSYKAQQSDLDFKEILGSGVCGTVYRTYHKPSNTMMAVKKMTITGNKDSDQQMLRDLSVQLRDHTQCRYIVTGFGCLVTDQSIQICMEEMLTCLENLYKKYKAEFPEIVLGKVAYSVLQALNYLKVQQNLIHRDIKPSNILVSAQGVFKLCDFGIAGKLENSMPATRSVGCVAYLAPERIEPGKAYDCRADVWSLGITIMELAIQRYPYPKFATCSSEFEVLVMIKDEEPPRLGADFSNELQHFTRKCVQKNFKDRPKYTDLLSNDFIKRSSNHSLDVAAWAKKYVPNRDCSATAPKTGGGSGGTGGS